MEPQQWPADGRVETRALVETLDSVISGLRSQGNPIHDIGERYVSFLTGFDMPGIYAKQHRFIKREKETLQLATKEFLKQGPAVAVADPHMLFFDAMEKFQYTGPRWRPEHVIYDLRGRPDFYHEIGLALVTGTKRYARLGNLGDAYLFKEYNLVYSALMSDLAAARGLSRRK